MKYSIQLPIMHYNKKNDRHIGDVALLFSVGTALDKVSGDTFPMLVGGKIGVEEPMNLMDMDISYDSKEWYDSLAFGEKLIVDEVMDDLSYEALVDKEESKCLTPPNIGRDR